MEQKQKAISKTENVSSSNSSNSISKIVKINKYDGWRFLISDLLCLCFQYLSDPLTELARLSRVCKHWFKNSRSYSSMDKNLHARLEYWLLNSDLSYRTRFM